MLTRLLLVAAVASLVACSAPSASNTAPADADLTINLADFMIDPSDVEVDGPMVTIEVTSDGPTPHNLTVRDADGAVVMATEDLSAGDSETIGATVGPGTYTIFCSLAGHESLGMSGSLVVGAP